MSFDFPQRGMISIFGKSGSGKSTLLNLISLLDKPDSGSIYFKGERVNKWDENRINDFHKNNLGIIFQQYNLLEDETAEFNIYLRASILKISNKEYEERLNYLLDYLVLDKTILNKKCKDLSGGQKQRVAILRALITSPDIIVTDEPTGALDHKNSIFVMDLLKKISKEKLVILVSHNKELVEKYSDEIVLLKDGQIEKKIIINKIEELKIFEDKKKKKSSMWVFKYGTSLFKKKKWKNIISIISYSISLIFSITIIGFINGSSKATVKASYSQLDYGVMKVSKEEITNIGDTKLKIVHETRPSIEEIEHLKAIYKDVIFTPNISYFFPLNPEISIGDKRVTDLTYNHIYSFDEKYIDKRLLIKGRFPISPNECVINKMALKSIALSSYINVSIIKEYKYFTGKEERPEVNDYFVCNKDLQVVGVVDDFSFLSSPKLFCSYLDDYSYLINARNNNLSDYFKQDITFYDSMMMEEDDSEISSYSISAFYTDYEHYENMERLFVKEDNKPVFSSLGRDRKNACLSMIETSSKGMELFLFITIIGSLMVIGILSFSTYSEERKNAAILKCLGASSKDNISIFLLINVLLAIISFSISLIISPLFAWFLNNILKGTVGIPNVIDIPFMKFMGVPFIFIPIILGSLLLSTFIASVLPIMFTKKISVVEELREK